MQPIIFLDCDGVIAPLVDGWKLGTVSRTCMQALNTLTAWAGAVVVVSSAWRYLYELPELRVLFAEQGMHGDPVIGRTPMTPPAPRGLSLVPTRGQEIATWLTANVADVAAQPFVILDDTAAMAPYNDYLVQTNPEVGLTQADVLRALQVLQAQGWEPERPRRGSAAC